MSKYIKQLTADLPRWVGMGYVTEPHAALIRADAEANQKEGWFRLPLILSMLGGLLVFVGVISWVAGNWNDIPRLTRTLLLVATMLGSLGLAHMFRKNGSEGLAQGFAFLAALMFGADIMLIAQIYQLPANPPGGALLWALGAAAVAIFWPSQLSMALAFVLAGVWSWFTVSNGRGDFFFLFRGVSELHLPFLLLWGVLAAYSVKREWNKALHVAGITLAAWAMYSLFALFDEQSARLAGVAIMLMVAGLTASGLWLQVVRPGAGIVSKYLWVLFAFWLLVTSAPTVYKELLGIGTLSLPNIYLLALGAGLAGLLFSLRRYAVASHVVPVAAGLAIAGLIGLLSSAGYGYSRYDYSHYASAGAGLYLFFCTVAVSVLTMGAAVGAVVHGYRSSDKFFINLGFVLFAFKLIWLYFDNEWGLANRAGFFIVGGLLVVALGIVFDRQRRKLIGKISPPPSHQPSGLEIQEAK